MAKQITTMYPEQRFYKASGQPATIVANRSTVMEDLYLVYTGKNPENGHPIIKAHLNPLVWWIWAGAHFILIGTLIALMPNMQAKRKHAVSTAAASRSGADRRSRESRAPVEAGTELMNVIARTCMLPQMRHRWPVVLMLFSAVLLMGAAGDRTGQRFDRLGHNLMCECGCGQVLLECNHVGCSTSEQMRKELKLAMDRGDSDDVVLAAFVAKYGPAVLAAPTTTGFNRVAWIMPVVIFLCRA